MFTSASALGGREFREYESFESTRVSRVRESYTNRRRTSRARVDDEILLSVRLRLYESSRVTTRGSRT